MAEFKDKHGSTWTIELDVGLVEDVQNKTTVNLDDMLEKPEEFASLLQKSPRKLVEMLYILCGDQIEERKIPPEEFGRLFNRETLDNATNALLEAIISFYPRASAGNALRKKLPQILAKMDQRIEKEANLAVDKVLLNTATD